MIHRFFQLRYPILIPCLLLGVCRTLAATDAAAGPGATVDATPSAAIHPSVVDKLIALATFGESSGYVSGGPNRTDAIIALGLIGDARAVPTLAGVLTHSPNPQTRLAAVRSLGWIGGSDVVPALEAALQDSYPFVRKQAATALKTITGREYEYDKRGLPDGAKLLESLHAARPQP